MPLALHRLGKWYCITDLGQQGMQKQVRLSDLSTWIDRAQALRPEQCPLLHFALLQWVFFQQEGPVARREKWGQTRGQMRGL